MMFAFRAVGSLALLALRYLLRTITILPGSGPQPYARHGTRPRMPVHAAPLTRRPGQGRGLGGTGDLCKGAVAP